MTHISDLKPGDRVRVSFEASYEGECHNGVALALELHTPTHVTRHTPTHFTRHEMSLMTIERIDPPLEIGDRVTWRRAALDDARGVLAAIVNDYGVVLASHTLVPVVVGLRNLRRAE